MSKTYSAGIVTAYGAAKRAGYQGTYEDFCRQQAGYAENAAAVEQAKTTAANAATTATAKAGEATTAATDAQNAKIQTEQAASQALTDIATARSGAISAVHTEGQTQTANARAQARAAAASATTASTKASEASASATSAGQSATNAAASATSAATSASAAQAVLESIPEDYSDLSEDVDKLKADLRAIDGKFGEITDVSSVNLLKPSLLRATGYYYDYTDGVTHVSYDYSQLVTEYIPVAGGTLYIRQTYSTTSLKILLVYCYDSEGNYLGQKNRKYDLIGSDTWKCTLFEGTAKVKIYTNTKEVTGSQICLSNSELAAFTAYDEIYTVKESALPDIDAGIDYLPLYGKKIVNFGDSIFGNKRPPNDISTALANLTGATVYNLGFGGCRMSQHKAGWDAFCMYQIAEAIATNDFSVQNAVMVGDVSGMPSYFEEARTLLESIDFSEVDIITISYGTNDFTAGVSLDNANDPDDTTTFCGALRYSLEKLMTAYPQLHVFVLTPTYRFWMDAENDYAFLYDSDTHEVSGELLTDFVSAVKTVANEYHVSCIDNYYELGINKFNRSEWFPATDGAHHNQVGGALIAKHMAIKLF